MRSKDWFKINGISSYTVEIYVDTPSVPPMAQQYYTTYQTNFDENSTYSDNIFDDITYSITFYTFYKDFDNTDIYSFLADAQTLEISRLPRYYYKIRQLSLDNPENVFRGEKIRYKLNFRLAPFRYFTENPAISVLNGSVISNNGTRYSKPTLRIVGTGDISVNVNDLTFEVKGLSENQEIIIDSSKFITYSGNELFHNRTTGKYPLLAVGENVISWSGNVKNVEISKNERCY
ncbi:MAG: hypothetical protein K2G36_08305 [Ruminococcus sp.]|nr:hypothetical protein [Ruminococcus sp.]